MLYARAARAPTQPAMSRLYADDEDESGEEPGAGDGYYPEAECFPLTGDEVEYKHSVNEWFMDPSYGQLHKAAIAHMFRRFDRDPNIRTVSQIYQATLFSGGVMFARPDAKLTESASHWYSTQWTAFGMELDRHQVSIGFAPCVSIPNALYVGVPTVLALERCTVLYKLDVRGVPHFVFFEELDAEVCRQYSRERYLARGGRAKMPAPRRRDKGPFAGRRAGAFAGGSFDCMYRYIPDVVVYVDVAPTCAGALRSKVSVLDDDIEMDDHVYAHTKAALDARSNPPLVIESANQRPTEQTILSSIQPFAMRLGDGSAPAAEEAPGFRDAAEAADPAYAQRAAQAAHERKMFDYASLLHSVGSSGMARAHGLAMAHMDRLSADGMREHHIQDGKRYVRHQLPESPDEFFLKFRVASKERVCELLGVPLSMLSQSSSLGKASMNENSLLIFTSTQKQKKQQLLGYFRDMYARIYLLHHTLHRLKGTPAGGVRENRLLPRATGAEAHVEVIMSGLPPDDVVTALFSMGALTFPAFVQYMSSKHSIPKSFFNATCELSLPELNGIKPAADAQPRRSD